MSIVTGMAAASAALAGGAVAKRAASSPKTQAVQRAANGINRINEMTNANNAFNAEQAQKQMDFQRESQQIAMKYNSAEAQKNRDWQKMMSDTAYQRQVRDLQAAGLNPVLAALNGNGAPVGSGATAAGVSGGQGSKADADTSGAMALVNLLGTIMDNQNQLRMQENSARIQEAYAERLHQYDMVLADLQHGYNMDAINLSGMYGLQQAQTSASATMYAASQSAQASRYVAEVNSMTYRLNSLVTAETQRRGQDLDDAYKRLQLRVTEAGQNYRNDQTLKNQRALQEAEQDFTEYIKKNYPDSWQKALTNGIVSGFGGVDSIFDNVTDAIVHGKSGIDTSKVPRSISGTFGKASGFGG